MWKYESNDYQNISLHDHLIDRITMQENNIILIFNNGFDVVKTHPLNQTGTSKQTTKAQIILKNAQFVKGEISRLNTTTHIYDLISLIDIFEVLEVLDISIDNSNIKLMGYLDTSEFRNEFSILLFCCSDAIFCWDDYESDAWFER